MVVRAAGAVTVLVAGLALMLAACGASGGTAPGARAALTVTSPDFAAGAPIPARFTCSGAGDSPALAWGVEPARRSPAGTVQGAGPPRGTRSFAVLVVDPDAPRGEFVHWIVYALPPSAHGLPEGAGQQGLPPGALQGRNGFGRIGYGGPCPPPGQTHRYEFHVYALDDVPRLQAGASAAQLRAAIGGHVLARGMLMATYGR